MARRRISYSIAAALTLFCVGAATTAPIPPSLTARTFIWAGSGNGIVISDAKYGNYGLLTTYKPGESLSLGEETGPVSGGLEFNAVTYLGHFAAQAYDGDTAASDVVIGTSAGDSANGIMSTVVGAFAARTGFYTAGTAIGQATNLGDQTIGATALAYGASALHNYSIALGHLAETTADHQFVVANVTDMYLGGVTTPTPIDSVTLHAPQGAALVMASPVKFSNLGGGAPKSYACLDGAGTLVGSAVPCVIK